MLFLNTVKKFYQNLIFKRCDDTGVARYFSVEDFEGLKCEPYSFKNSAGEMLQGYFYNYANSIEDRLVIFDHGMGGGHLSYMKEIEILARHGYKVFAYDHTGCMESEGVNCGGFTQSLSDLNCCLNALKADKKNEKMKLAVMGHSWGGFAALNIPAFYPDLTHVIVLSGFISVKAIARSFGTFDKVIYAVEKAANPKYVDCNAVDSLKNTSAKVLLVYSNNDPLVKKEINFDVLKDGLSGRANTQLLLESGKDHNPNYTSDAVKYLGEYLKSLKQKKKQLKTDGQKKAFVQLFDWEKMTAQDDSVWKKIFEVLDN